MRNPRGLSPQRERYDLYEVCTYIKIHEEAEQWFRCLIMATSEGEAEGQMMDMFGQFLGSAAGLGSDEFGGIESFKIEAKQVNIFKQFKKTGLGRLGYIERYEGSLDHRGDFTQGM